MIVPLPRLWIACAVVMTIGASPSGAQTASDPLAAVDVNMSAAEDSLRAGELEIAESRYRSALAAGWMLMGALDAADDRLADARDAFLRASTSAFDASAALQSLAVVHLQMGDAASAVTLLTRLSGANPGDVQNRRLLAQALIANGQADEAVQELEETANARPDDPEIKYALASGYLRLKNVDAAERLFGEVAKVRPLPETYVLIGRTYRDAGQYDRARSALATALEMDPRVRRAHYYLGTIAVMQEGVIRLDEAIAEFQQELRVAPNDPTTNLRLGMALVEARRDAAAVPALEIAVRGQPAAVEAFYYLGRCQLALSRVSEAVTSFKRALEVAAASRDVDDARLRSIHYQLALALQKFGAPEEAAEHFTEAQRFSEKRLATERERLGRYLADVQDGADVSPAAAIMDVASLTGLSPQQRADVERRTRTALARAYLNLGVMHAQKQRFTRAADFFEQAVAVDADFPQAQYSLGVAYFNSQQYAKAVRPLARALDADRASALVRRMLAIAYLNTEAYGQSAALLADDPQRDNDSSLQYAYGLALVRSGRAADAEAIFSRLLGEHANSPEVSVVLGHVYAQQGNYDAAIEALQRALRLRADVADANSALGLIYLKQGKLSDAEAALHAELTHHPADVKARHTLATVLDLEGRADQALVEARTVVKANPEFADARYLLGKILLAGGAADEAAMHLEAAARTAPQEANIHYQLARAYERLGRAELAEKEFATYRDLKDKQRGKTP
jgi:tetratricopeptide (TPR) repeat protein